ncbi:hypothetical protein IVA98_24320 [Bradyrhizobium sp. 160]|uniref:hypothetical protein n=1 Tax=unclassified Bradyrhizobium TaxID=2631580 RepID=UPI001FFB3BFB|nr:MULTISPECIES: hypothetical protein [unclassified Bradyrhizobium]MCK1541167.1 hypothetical protein [Bradyrhizobium sp. 179]MCK1626231.1 hypothetical protein [Bradyrhizobium sp. 160]
MLIPARFGDDEHRNRRAGHGSDRVSAPAENSTTTHVGTLAVFSTYAVGFTARLIGGATIGHYGGRLGRLIVAASRRDLPRSETPGR